MKWKLTLNWHTVWFQSIIYREKKAVFISRLFFTEENNGLIGSFFTWCNDNHLMLIINKIYELVVDYQINRRTGWPLSWLRGSKEGGLKYLGVKINKKLNWPYNIEALFKKGQSRLFFLRFLPFCPLLWDAPCPSLGYKDRGRCLLSRLGRPLRTLFHIYLC